MFSYFFLFLSLFLSYHSHTLTCSCFPFLLSQSSNFDHHMKNIRRRLCFFCAEERQKYVYENFYVVECIVDNGTHYLPPCQFLIFQSLTTHFTATDNIYLFYNICFWCSASEKKKNSLPHIHIIPPPYITWIVPSDTSHRYLFVYGNFTHSNSVLLVCIGIDSVLRQLNIQL